MENLPEFPVDVCPNCGQPDPYGFKICSNCFTVRVDNVIDCAQPTPVQPIPILSDEELHKTASWPQDKALHSLNSDENLLETPNTEKTVQNSNEAVWLAKLDEIINQINLLKYQIKNNLGEHGSENQPSNAINMEDNENISPVDTTTTAVSNSRTNGQKPKKGKKKSTISTTVSVDRVSNSGTISDRDSGLISGASKAVPGTWSAVPEGVRSSCELVNLSCGIDGCKVECADATEFHLHRDIKHAVYEHHVKCLYPNCKKVSKCKSKSNAQKNIIKHQLVNHLEWCQQTKRDDRFLTTENVRRIFRHRGSACDRCTMVLSDETALRVHKKTSHSELVYRARCNFPQCQASSLSGLATLVRKNITHHQKVQHSEWLTATPVDERYTLLQGPRAQKSLNE